MEETIQPVDSSLVTNTTQLSGKRRSMNATLQNWIVEVRDYTPQNMEDTGAWRTGLIDQYGRQLDLLKSGAQPITDSEIDDEKKRAGKFLDEIINLLVPQIKRKRILEPKKISHLMAENPSTVESAITTEWGTQVDLAGRIRKTAEINQDRHDHFFYTLHGIGMNDLMTKSDLDDFRKFDKAKHTVLGENHALTKDFAAPLFENMKNCKHAARNLWDLLVLTDARNEGTYRTASLPNANYADFHVPDFMYKQRGGEQSYAAEAKMALVGIYQGMIFRLSQRLEKADFDGTSKEDSAIDNITKVTGLEERAAKYLREKFKLVTSFELEKDGNYISAARILNHVNCADDFFRKFFSTPMLNDGKTSSDQGYCETAEADLKEKYKIILQWSGIIEQRPHILDLDKLATEISTPSLSKDLACIPEVKPGIKPAQEIWTAFARLYDAAVKWKDAYEKIVKHI